MIPFILAAVGGYFIGNSIKSSFAKGGNIAMPMKKDDVEYVVIRLDKKARTLADFKDKKEAIDFIYNYKLSNPKAKLDYFKFADGGMLSQTKVGTIETADYNQYTGKLKDISEQIIELNFGDMKGKETTIYATVEDDDGIERRGIVTDIFHFEIDKKEKVIEIDEALMIFLYNYNYLLDRHINFIKPNLYFVYYDELNEIERKELSELLGEDL